MGNEGVFGLSPSSDPVLALSHIAREHEVKLIWVPSFLTREERFKGICRRRGKTFGTLSQLF